MLRFRPRHHHPIVVRCFVWVSVLAGASAASGQRPVPTLGPDSLAIGARVRAITSLDSVRIEGFVRAASLDTVRIGECKQCDPGTPIPLSTLRTLEVERRRHKVTVGATIADMGIGALLGVVAGGATGWVWAYYDVHQPNCGDSCGLSWLAVPYLAIAGGAVGLVGGGVVGLSAHHESYWVGVRLPAP